ncbi:MAG: hypothetical protein Kow0062_04550 [Acidobacteriota bacterium]
MSLTSVPRHLAHWVPARFRHRGDEYRRHGRVRIVSGNDVFVEAAVQGSALYTVRLAVHPETAELLSACTCPWSRRSYDPCKHVWAVLSEAFSLGHLDGARQAEVLRNAEGEIDRLEELVRRGPDAGDYQPIAWSQLPGRMRASQASSKDGAPLRLIYEIDVTGSGQAGYLVVALLRQRRLKRGGWGAPRPARLAEIARRRLGELDAADRRLAALLCDIQQSVSAPWTPAWRDDIVALDSGRAEMLLPRLCATGRLCLSSRSGEPSATGPWLSWDKGPAWQLEIALVEGDTPSSYELRGSLVRGEERLEASEVRLVFDRIMFTRDRVAVWQHHGAIDLLGAMMVGIRPTLPRQDGPRFVSELLSLPDPPRMQLPSELAIERVRGVPIPTLEVSLPETTMRGDTLDARLSFAYEDMRAAEDLAGPVLRQPDRRREIVRDRGAEQHARERLDSLGVTAADPSAGERVTRGLPVGSFAKIVETLLAEGWRVEAESKPIRPPGRPSASVSSGIDWFELEASVDYDGEEIPLPRLLAARQGCLPLVSLSDGSWGLSPEEWLERLRLAEAFAGGRSAKPDAAGDERLRFSRSQVGVLGAVLEGVPGVERDTTFERALRRVRRLGRIRPAASPRGFRGALRPYQAEGVAWMKAVTDLGLGGCLADDMGLGKTIQTLALLQARRNRQRRGERRTSLVLAPRSVLQNWKSEASRFTPQLDVLVHHGAGRTREAGPLQDADVVLTTYGTLLRDLELLSSVPFRLVVLDEAQAIKNTRTKISAAVRRLDAVERLALSGTPVENHLGELWTLLDFLNPGLLGRSTVLRNLSRAHSELDEPTREVLSRAVRPFLLRRTKQEVAPELPERSEQTLQCELGRTQRSLYRELQRHYRARIREALASGDRRRSGPLILEGLTRLRQAACHPGLIDPDRTHLPSAKLDLLEERLDELLAEGHKALVFSQFTKLLAIVRRRLEDREIPYAYLDGRTRRRAEVVREFQQDDELPVFLISLKAGGLGLNLTAASYVFLLDPWWNPSVEAQAIDRSHRIGQANRVSAYRLVAADTIEERVLELQDRKRLLADAVLRQTRGPLASLTTEELEFLFS